MAKISNLVINRKNYFKNILKNAIKICNCELSEDIMFQSLFYKIYPFTTENIAGYIGEFDLKDKTLLTVGSSLDQAFNGILYDCKTVTVVDVNPYIRFYYNLKKACLFKLDLNDFLKFLSSIDYSRLFQRNKNLFNLKYYNRIKSTLKALDYESYLFWDELFHKFSALDIRHNLFNSDEYETYINTKANPYLRSISDYKALRKKIEAAEVSFVYGDLFEMDLENKYDNIWLSNIGAYLSRHSVKMLVDKMANNLNGGGQMLVSYLYEIPSLIPYQCDWSPIYDLDRLFVEMAEYELQLKSFIGINGIKYDDTYIKDSILVYKK